ncbi:mRNA export factor GLE1-like [Acropora muricata]|uniref:mRNA export factor GLE1-like n=1 Tax=Acropora muricata TaxID=159855 RepID=UPI0034E5F2CF
MNTPAKTTAKKSKSMKPMVWSTVHDEMLCREILVVDPFTGTKKGTVARGTKWEEVAENLNKIEQVYFKVDKRAVRDRYNLLSRELRKLKREEKESGIETDMTEVEMALEELIEKEDAAETEQRVVENQKKVKDSQDRENAESVRKNAMERLGQTQKRKADEGESEGKKKKKRSSGSDTLNFLREKNEQVQEMQKQELELKRQQLEVESKKQENFMQMMLNQQQQQQRQLQNFQAMMSVQTKQQNDLILALVSKLTEKNKNT